MPGGLIQLKAIGAQDLNLTGNQISFLKQYIEDIPILPWNIINYFQNQI